ncbi:hypothetical protein MU654_21115 [Salmonella enterica subsp. enterica serovar Enteritidis]|uniref:Uncharacterized protein n=1 Tax=Shigella flexneri TaxID=623 RepID=A0A3T2UUX5_SHIFL|nr:hypothetical protein [Escherichia coli]EAA0482189.1 hypothetical protein [Shigella flexneri]EDB7677444.1 hypothetical protein [Salmonella enterica]MBJ2859323.1 hypothetical protein [Salmonella enterica subsp. enterica serovar Derby]MCL8993747.1 hypothetical protein [Salmonella enterica subsp. enterica serovar Enteritidis]MBJ5551299.1 hypothetical protein [Salmonella enterica subsp. enterica serovar Derby]
MKSEGLTPEQLAERNAQYVTEISRLEKERAALAAENAGLKAICDDCRRFIMNGVQMGYIKVPTAETDPDLETIRIAISPQKPIPATDAFLAEVRAQGLEMFAQKCNSKSEQSIASDIRDNWKLLGEHATDFAAELRKGGKQ